MTIQCMIHQCYYCDQVFETKERLYDHLEDHAKTKSKQLDDGKSTLSDREILDQFNDTKIGEPTRMRSRKK